MRKLFIADKINNPMVNINKYINNGNLKIIVKLNSKNTEIIKYDEDKKALIVQITQEPKENKANIEIIKFFTKILKKKIRIKSGLTSKEKILQIQ